MEEIYQRFKTEFSFSSGAMNSHPTSIDELINADPLLVK